MRSDPDGRDAAGWISRPRFYLVVKRLLDVVLGAVLVVVTAPIMALTAAAIRLDTPGPVLFRQERVGKDGATFEMIKFRSMIAGNDDSIHRDYYRRLVEGTAEARTTAQGEQVFLLDDPRVTRVGRILRRTSLDELPNVFNVLTGDMSLVGPRPSIHYEVDLYDERARGRLAVKPGMTGLAQVRGRGALTFQEIIELDLEYVARRSLWLDFKILLATPAAVVKRRGV
jgi:lipopolysaccharide/colanic/teichoic acid biosynthesis glycosyltransferase